MQRDGKSQLQQSGPDRRLKQPIQRSEQQQCGDKNLEHNGEKTPNGEVSPPVFTLSGIEQPTDLPCDFLQPLEGCQRGSAAGRGVIDLPGPGRMRSSFFVNLHNGLLPAARRLRLICSVVSVPSPPPESRAAPDREATVILAAMNAEAPSSVTFRQDRQASAPGASLATSLSLAIGISLIGCGLLAIFEVSAATAFVRRRMHGESIPLLLWWAALGKVAITQLVAWTPALLLTALLHWAALGRRGRGRPAGALACVFLLIVGFIVLPLDLQLADRDTPTLLNGGRGAAVALAIVLFAGIRWASKRPSAAVWGRRAYHVAWSAALAFHLVAGFCFARSPLIGAATYRVETQPAGAERSAGRPDVLLIVLDTARADRTSLHGYSKPTTPLLNELAKSALVCDRAISNGMWTVPSHASLFTGLSLRQHGADHRHLRLDDAHQTLAEVLREAGYATGFFSNNPLIAPSTNMTQGFQTRRVIHDLKRISRFSLEYFFEQRGWIPPAPWLDDDFGAGITNWMISNWLTRQGEQPVFLFVNYMEAHLPYRVPKEYRRQFMSLEQLARSYELRYSVHGNILEKLDLDYNLTGSGFLQESDAEILRAQYDATIRYLDDRVEELLGIFSQRGRQKNMLVIITADHGEYLGEHGMWGHRFLAHHTVTSVPLLIRDARKPAPGRLTAPAQLSDVFATVQRAVFGDEAGPAPGESCDLFGLAGSGGVNRVAISKCSGPEPRTLARFLGLKDPRVLHRPSPQIAAVGERYKYLQSADGMRELYDLSVDAGEQNNLLLELPERAAEFEAYIADWLARTPEYKLPPGQSLDVPPETLQSMKSLGYLGAEDDGE